MRHKELRGEFQKVWLGMVEWRYLSRRDERTVVVVLLLLSDVGGMVEESGDKWRDCSGGSATATGERKKSKDLSSR